MQTENLDADLTEANSAHNAEPARRIPLKIEKKKPIVVWVLFILTIIIFIAQEGTKYFYGTDFPLILGAKYGPAIVHGEFWRLITPIFLHGGFMHIAFNMYALMIIGPELEEAYGHRDFLLFYLITGFAGNVASFVISPQSISVGASTAIFGMIVAQAFFIYHNRRFFPNFQKAIQNVVVIIGLNLFMGLRPGIDNWGHIGGLIAGALIAGLSGPVLDFRFSPDFATAVLYDRTSSKRRIIAMTLTFAFFAALAFAFRRFALHS